MTETATTIGLTIGTAGHIDHGKTAVVKWLTGCDCDRLPEEKARGMTIDLGFAVWQLDGVRRVGIVDVPGHERFIHNMVAGASGIDVLMLVVAADDGVMPQTVEHVQIVRMLGIRRGLVVINKTDLADETRLVEVERQVRELVRGTFLEQSPIVRFSARTGAGFDVFHAALLKVVDETVERDASGPFRMHVERAFVLQGLGTIISGIPRMGRVGIGDEVELLPAGTRHTVKGLQVYGAAAGEGRAGECSALRLSNLSRDEVGRGMVLAAPGYFRPARFLNIRFLYLPNHERPLEPRTAVRLHVGTAEAPGHLVLPELARLEPGAECYAQLQLSRPLVAAPGDFVVVRQLNPVTTLGGGHVIDCSESKLRRSRGDWIGERERKEDAGEDSAKSLLLEIDKAGDAPLTLTVWARKAGIAMDNARSLAEKLATAGQIIALPGSRYASRAALEDAAANLIARLNDLHDARPLELGFEKKDILRVSGVAFRYSTSGTPESRMPRRGPGVLDKLLVDRAFDVLLADGRLIRDGLRYHLRGREPNLSPQERVLADRISSIYTHRGFTTPRPDELPGLIGADWPVIEPLVTHLLQTGELVRLNDKVLMHRSQVALSRDALLTYLATTGRLHSGDFKDILGTTRKYAIPLLEYWDRMGLTRRDGDDRVLREQPKEP